MASGAESPTLLRMELRSSLRAHRAAARLKGEAVVEAIQDAFAGSFSTAKLSRIESGQQLPSPRDVSDLAHVYNLDRAERDRLVQLAKDAKRPGWWEEYEAPEDDYQRFIDLESAASSLRNYESTFVPGLLQTEDYTKTIINKLNKGYSDEDVAGLLELRMRRQKRLEGPDPLRLHAVIQENSLRRTVGSPEVMLNQIDHLLRMAQMPNITLQVIRFDAGVYAGLQASAFVLMDFPEAADVPTVCYLEGILWSMFANGAQQKARMVAAWDEMCTEVAQSPLDTPRFLVDIRDRVARRAEGGT